MKITLKAARINAGYTQSQVAKIIDTTIRTVINYELGYTSPRYDVLQRLAQIYRIDVENITMPKRKNK